MRREWAPYWEWEDWKAGMYEVPPSSDASRLAIVAAGLLSDSVAFNAAARQAVAAWPVAAAVNLTAVGSNRRSWVGQAACCYRSGVPELATRLAWKTLTEPQKELANEVAEQVIRDYERTRREVRFTVAESGLFVRDTGRSPSPANGSREGSELQGYRAGDSSWRFN